MDVDCELRRLFDLSTVEKDATEYRSPTKIVKNIITITKPVMRNSTVSICTEQYIRFDEIEIDQFAMDLRLNIIKPCGTRAIEEGNSPVMPSLRLDMLDREYKEPVRNREKDWVLDSQRPIINEKGNDIVSPQFSVPLGKYKSVDPTSKQFWAKEYQTMLRECCLLRKAAIISETNCIVQIHGVGFTGRMFSEGSTSPKLLVIEVYSIWNSQKYTVVLTVMELRLLLVENPELLKPGRRADLLKTLVKSLYFKYTITIPPKDPVPHFHENGSTSHDTSQNSDSGKAKKTRGPSKRQLRLEMKQKLLKELLTHDHALTFDELHHTHTHTHPETSPDGTEEESSHSPVYVPHIHFFNKLKDSEGPMASELLQGNLHHPGHHQHLHHNHHDQLHDHHHRTQHHESHHHQEHAGSNHSPRRTVVHAHGKDHYAHVEPIHCGLQDHCSTSQHDHKQSPRQSSPPTLTSRNPGNSQEVQREVSPFFKSADKVHKSKDGASPRPTHSQSVSFFQMESPCGLICAAPNEQGEIEVDVNRSDELQLADRSVDEEIIDVAPYADSVATKTTSSVGEPNELLGMLAVGNDLQDGDTERASHDHDSEPEPEPDSVFPEVGMSHEEPADNSIASANPDINSKAYVQRVCHLDPPVMPRGYPTTVEQMIRLPPVLPENSTDPMPIVTQELHIGPVRLYNGIKLRKLQAKEKRLAEEKEEKRLLDIWLATPKRKRNLVCIRLVRRCNYLVLLTGYFDPIRPNTILLKGMVYSEATKMSMFLGLGKIQDILHTETPSQAWSRDELKAHASRVMRYAGIIRADFGGYAINVNTATGLEAMLRKPHTVNEFLALLRARQHPLLHIRMHDPDSLSPFHIPVLCEFPDEFGLLKGNFSSAAEISSTKQPALRPLALETKPQSTVTSVTAADPFDAVDNEAEALHTSMDVPPAHPENPHAEVPAGTAEIDVEADAASQINIPAPVLVQIFPRIGYKIVAHEQPSWSSLGAQQSGRCPGKNLGALLRPAREIGRSRRLTCQAIRVGHVHCIFSLYANTQNMVNYREPFPVWPAREPAAASLDDSDSVASERKLEEEEEEPDFMKTGSGSDDDGSDSDSDEGRGNNNKKGLSYNARKKGMARKTGSDSIDPEDVLGDNLNDTDEKNDAYAEVAVGLVLELNVYVPTSADYQETNLLCGTYKISFTVDDLDKIFPAEEKELLFRALRTVYKKFFDSATAEEVRTAETDWEYIGRCIMRKASWARRVPLSPAVATVVSDLQHSKLSIDLLQDLFDTTQRMEYVRTLLYSDAEFVATATVPEDDALSAEERHKYAPMDGEAPPTVAEPSCEPYVTLTWSNIVHRKVIKVRSATSERGETVRLQIVLFQIGEALGVVCYDRERNEVSFAQHFDEALLQSQIRGFRFISGNERSLQLYFFLTASLVYAEVEGQDGVKRGKVTFGAVEEEEAGIIDSADVIEGDYSAATELLLNSAADKAQKRMKRK